MKQKRNWQVRPAQKFEVSDDWLQSQLGRLPYTLTDAQNKAIDLAVLAELSVSAVSHQLRLLRDRDLVQARRDGRMVYYSLADDHVSTLLNTGTEHANE